MKITLPIILNSILIILPAFLGVYSLCLFFKVDNLLRIICAGVIALCIGAAFATLSIHSDEKKSAYKSVIATNSAKLSYLPTLSVKELLRLFSAPFKERGATVLIKSGYFSVNGDTAVLPVVLSEAVSKNEVLKAVRKIKGQFKRYLIISNEFSTEAESLELFDQFILIRTSAFLPLIGDQIALPDGSPAKRLGLLKFKGLIERANSNKFILYGALTITMSFLVLYPTYYIISGSILLLFGFLIKFFGVKTTQTDKLEGILEKLSPMSTEES